MKHNFLFSPGLSDWRPLSYTSVMMTPLMQQYWQIKNQHLDKILLFRMGDFYEMFFDDAKTAAPILNIALTSRNKKAEDETPMCGMPYHSVSGHISKLLSAGLKVALCDQLEDPAEAKGIVKRGVTRILSPGMVYDPETLAELNTNYVAAYDDQTLSFLEASTGECFYYQVKSEQQILSIILALRPAEIIFRKSQWRENIKKQIALEAPAICLTEFNEYEDLWPERFANAHASSKHLLTYATHMQGASVLAALNDFSERRLSDNINLSTNVIKHLEIFKSYRGEDRGSLFFAMNRTKTSAGARCLKNWLQLPLVNIDKITSRQNRVEEWYKKPSDLKILRQALAGMGDIERRLAKVAYSNCHVRDLAALKESLLVGLQISHFCHDLATADIAATEKMAHEIQRTLADELPLNMKAGNYIRTGVSSDLDELITLSESGQKLLFDLEERERTATQIANLKIKYNNVFGYFIEVTNSHKDKVPDHYKRKQTLSNAERYITQELHELESKILSSRERRFQLEEIIFSGLREIVLKVSPLLMKMAARWSELDVTSSLAWLALEQKYVRPTFTGDRDIYLEASRHPVVEQEVKKNFVPNTLHLNSGDCLLLTGPNMAGKSTLMRQVAVTSLMAQMGSFVPAAKASLPIFEQVFTRIGASDSLSEGLSTFMVEMNETAEMLLGANEKTLVILDEVGRGTSTYDGMSLAQAILEYLITNAKSLTLFATHYHEITHLAEKHSQIKNAHMSVQERSGAIQFLYLIKRGPANKSYGIQVAKLAGLPASVIARATELLENHEQQVGGISSSATARLVTEGSARQSQATQELPLFNFHSDDVDMSEPLHPAEVELLKKLKTFKTQEVSPLQALNQIAQWQQELT